MSHLRDRAGAGQLRHAHNIEDWPGSAFYDEQNVRAAQSKVDLLAAHMHQQMKAHDAAMVNTHQVFRGLLDDMKEFAAAFEKAFAVRLPEESIGRSPGIFCQVDPDCSVGILNILWHAISFTTRGNTKPLALNRPGRAPQFTGRIIAMNGDFMDGASNLQSPYFGDLLQHEIASLFVPADPSAPAVMRIKHLSGEELYFHQVDAPRRFLLKVVEITCGGGYFHEAL